ncbi:MAG TPA: DUF4198 domain-containing protein [Rhodocyclaceae bacterium]
MTSNFAKTFLIAALAALVPLSAQAHRTWLLPSATVLDGKEPWVTFDAAVSEDLFDFDTNAQKLDVLEVLGPDGTAVKPENAFTGRLRSSFDLKLAKPGTYKVSMVREGAMVSYKVGGELKRWRGDEKDMAKEIPANAEGVQVTRQHARQETYVTAGKTSDAVLKKQSGVGIELVALTHPNELFAGETARFRLLLDGKPLANHLFGIVPGGVRYRGVLNEIAISTDAKGEFSVKWPAAGMYWLNASWPARGDGPPVMVPRRASYSVTLEVLPQ